MEGAAFMSRFLSDEELEAAWKSSTESVPTQSLDRLIDGTLAELRSLKTRQHESAEFSNTRRNDSASFYWAIAAMLFVGVHLGIAAAWSSSFDWSRRLREPKPVGDILLARRQMIQAIDSELKSIIPTASHSSID